MSRFLASILLVLICSVTLVCAQDSKEVWGEWLDRYASTSAFVASNKNHDWPVSETDIDHFLKNEKVYIPKGLKQISGEPIKGSYFVRENFPFESDVAPNHKERFAAIIREMNLLIEQRKPDELLILFVGMAHALEHHLRNLLFEKEVQGLVYAAPIRKSNSIIADENARYVMSRFEKSNVATRIGEDNIVSYVAPFSAILEVGSIAGLSASGIFKERIIDSPKVIVLMDYHSLRKSGSIEDLPTAADLRSMGIKKVIVGLEGFTPSTTITRELVSELADSGRFFRKFLPETLNDFRLTDPKLYEILSTQSVIMTPGLQHLNRWVGALGEAELNFEYRGLDPASEFEKTINVLKNSKSMDEEEEDIEIAPPVKEGKPARELEKVEVTVEQLLSIQQNLKLGLNLQKDLETAHLLWTSASSSVKKAVNLNETVSFLALAAVIKEENLDLLPLFEKFDLNLHSIEIEGREISPLVMPLRSRNGRDQKRIVEFLLRHDASFEIDSLEDGRLTNTNVLTLAFLRKVKPDILELLIDKMDFENEPKDSNGFRALDYAFFMESHYSSNEIRKVRDRMRKRGAKQGVNYFNRRMSWNRWYTLWLIPRN